MQPAMRRWGTGRPLRLVTAAVLATVLSMVLAAPADTQQAPASAELRREWRACVLAGPAGLRRPVRFMGHHHSVKPVWHPSCFFRSLRRMP